jgi:uncharacterized SAM-dependent methyltransferase
MPVSLKLAKQIERQDIHSICLLNGLCSEIWMAFISKIGFSIDPSDALFVGQQLLSCGLELEEVYDDRQKIVNEYLTDYIERYKN